MHRVAVVGLSLTFYIAHPESFGSGDHGHRGGSHGLLVEIKLGDLTDGLRGLGPGFGFRVVGAQQSSMHLFLAKWRLTPAKITQAVGAMGKRLQRPESNHTWRWAGIVIRPVDWAGLLFHYPKPLLGQPSGLVVIVTGEVGVASAHVAAQLFTRCAAEQ